MLCIHLVKGSTLYTENVKIEKFYVETATGYKIPKKEIAVIDDPVTGKILLSN